MTGNPSMVPRVSVVVPVFNRAHLLPELIRCLENQTVPVETIVVDDGSTDSPGEFLRTTSARFLTQPNQGPAAARNLGARHAAGEFLAFTDSDCRPHQDWIEHLLEGFQEPEVGAVAGTYAIGNPKSRLARLIQAEIAWRHRGFGPTIRAFGSYNVAIRRELFFRLGGFDPTYQGASGEDNDLSYRVVAAGFKIRFSPTAVVEHVHPESLLSYLRTQFHHGFWRAKLYKTHPHMVGGDDYTRAKDLLEIPLAVATLGLVISNVWTHRARSFPWWLGTWLLWSFVEIPPALEISFYEKHWEPLLLAPLAFCRAFARLSGLIRGLATP